MSYLAVDGFE